MKILIAQPEDVGLTNYFMGFAETLAYCGHQVSFWSQKVKPAFDMFDEFEPELCIIDQNNCNDSVIKCIRERPMCDFACYGQHDRANLCFSDTDPNLVLIKQASNVIGYKRPELNKMFSTDLLYIGRYRPILDRIYCDKKIFGEKFRSEFSLGNISKENIPDAFYSANTLLHMYDNEAQSSQQIYDALFCKAFVISNIGYEFQHEKDNPLILWQKTLDLDIKFQYNDEEILEESRNYIFKFHTYFDRCEELFNALDLKTDEITDGKKRYANECL